VARGPKQLEEIEEGDESDIEVDSKDRKDGEDEAEKKEEGEGIDMLGRTPRLLVIEDLEEDGSGDDQELDDIVIVIDDLEGEGSGADDQELGDILEDLVTATEEENFTGEVSKSEFSPENNPTEGAADEKVEPAKEIMSPKNELGDKNGQAGEEENTFSDSESVASSVNSVDLERAQSNDSQEEKENISPLKGIKTILVVTTNPDKNDPAVELPEKEIAEATVSSTK